MRVYSKLFVFVFYLTIIPQLVIDLSEAKNYITCRIIHPKKGAILRKVGKI